jgi:hypothetical protein
MGKIKEIIMIFALLLCVQGCAGMIVGAIADTAIEIAKIPFKVGGAIADVIMGDDESGKDKRLKERQRAEEYKKNTFENWKTTDPEN